MKTPRLLFAALVPAILLLLLQGCSEQSAPETNAAEPMLIQPHVSVGKVRAGMSVDQVRAVLGEPKFKTANALEYSQLGFAVMHGPDNLIQVVMCGDVTGLQGPFVKRFAGKTKEGIGLGSSREELVNAYGDPSHAEKFPGGRESLRYDPLGITFSLENGKVHHMIVRLTPPNQGPALIEVKP
jgi:hypothetical protein